MGGDFFDAIELEDGSIRAVVGDVCGHGPDEAALGVALRVAWRALVLAGQPPDITLSCLHRVVEAERQQDHIFATVCDIELHPDREHAQMYLGGHPAPLLLADGDVFELEAEAHGPLLGVFDDSKWPANRVELGPEWTLVLFTDGIIEGRAGVGEGERFKTTGLARLARQALAETRDLESLADQLIVGAERANGARCATMSPSCCSRLRRTGCASNRQPEVVDSSTDKDQATMVQSLRARLNILIVVLTVAIIAITAFSTAAFLHLSDARHRLLNQIDPASLSADQVLLAYVDEETGIRGYILGRNFAYLSPAISGFKEQTAATKQLNATLADQPALLRSAKRAEHLGQVWQTNWALPAFKATAAERSTYTTPQELAQGKTLLDHARTAFTTLDDQLSASRQQYGDNVNTATKELVIVLLVGLVLLVGGAIAVSVALRRWVTRRSSP